MMDYNYFKDDKLWADAMMHHNETQEEMLLRVRSMQQYQSPRDIALKQNYFDWEKCLIKAHYDNTTLFERIINKIKAWLT